MASMKTVSKMHGKQESALSLALRLTVVVLNGESFTEKYRTIPGDASYAMDWLRNVLLPLAGRNRVIRDACDVLNYRMHKGYQDHVYWRRELRRLKRRARTIGKNYL
jgi:hypothetical protein